MKPFFAIVVGIAIFLMWVDYLDRKFKPARPPLEVQCLPVELVRVYSAQPGANPTLIYVNSPTNAHWIVLIPFVSRTNLIAF